MEDIRLYHAFRAQPSYVSEPHRFFVIAGPDEFNHVLTVMVSSIKYRDSGRAIRHDQSCVLVPSDHDSLTLNSYVAFNRAEWIERSAVARRVLSFDEDISPELRERILWAALNSSQTPFDVRKDVQAILEAMLKKRKKKSY